MGELDRIVEYMSEKVVEHMNKTRALLGEPATIVKEQEYELERLSSEIEMLKNKSDCGSVENL